MTTPKIGVFPAAGALGTSIYTHLLSLHPPKDITLISRNPSKIPQKHISSGTTTRKADYDDPSTLTTAFTSLTHLILISYPSLEITHRVNAHKTAINAALDSGVTHIFYTSLAFGGDCTTNSAAHVMQAHLQTESYLRSLTTINPQLTFTVIREGLYSESSPMYTGFPDLLNPPDTVKIPHSGSGTGIAWAKIDDLGEATARLAATYITQPDTHTIQDEYTNKTVLLSGPRAYSIADTVSILSSVVGKEIKIQGVSVDEYAADPVVQGNLGSHGEGDVSRKWATSFDGVREGECAVESERLGRLLGREPEGFEVTVRAMVRAMREGDG